MKNHLILPLAAVLCAFPSCKTNEDLADLNMPIIQTKFTADPAPLVHDGVVYLFTTCTSSSAATHASPATSSTLTGGK